MKYLNVAINLPVKNIFQQFTYKVPPQLDFLKEGWRVVVPFGHQMLEGFVVDEALTVDEAIKYKEIVDVLGTEPWFTEEMIATAHYLSKYYMCSLAEALRLFIPGKGTIATIGRYTAREDFTGSLEPREEQLYAYLQIKGPQPRKAIVTLDRGEEALKGLITKQAVALEYEIKYKIKNRTVRTFCITEDGQKALAENNKKIKAQNSALNVLQVHGEMTVPELEQFKVSSQTLRNLAAKGWAKEGARRVLRDSYKDKGAVKEVLQLTDEQKQAISSVSACLEKSENNTFLLQGITGSGKTEVYLRLTDKALREGKQVLVLVPEIALTGQIVKRFKAWFGNKVAVAHSKLSAGERADVWQKMRSDYASVLIGVRSAVFSPFHNLGLIIIDEEHEYTYKQDERPNYHARNIGAFRAKFNKAPLVLGSATPDLESYYKAQEGSYTHLRLTKRPMAGSHLPQVEIVDMRKELQEGNKSVISRKLQAELSETIKAGEQAIVLLNRRGFSTFVMCRDCGTTLTCPNCAVSLVYHAKEHLMQCHYCGHTEPIPTVCPHCHSKRIKFFGTGTEKAEAEIAALGNGIRPIRMDQDSTMAKFAHEEILESFVKGEYNVLLGTQMVAKGHDIPNVTLVGVLSADSQLNLPDYRSGERTFALLTQAAGRAGRGAKPGRVVFQAYDAGNPVLAQAASQDYEGFAVNELAVRKELGYPPFTSLIKITVVHKDQEKALETAQRLVNYLEGEQLAGKLQKTQVMGPFPAIVAMVNHIYRINILIKSTEPEEIKGILWHSEYKEMSNVYFDVDPVNVI
ncbi:MAG: primosomal protein N' [Acidaminococcaceae bacterium]|jgi:primosomal protein N' (replication factor Y)|nr:primosomal protein N' [Acidaminococcaceae bacterium]